MAAPGKMHADEVDTSVALVQRLVGEQFPSWSALPIRPVASSGTDNAMYRIGTELVARLPRVANAALDVDREHSWLPWLAARLPVAVPTPVGKGVAGSGYPYAWSIYRWLGGVNPVVGELADPLNFARDLGATVRALHVLETGGWRTSERGRPLATRDQPTRKALAQLDGAIDVRAAAAAWDAALAIAPWAARPVCLHSDLAPGNLLTTAGRLSAIIDWSGFGVGDPAIDCMPAWNLLPFSDRDEFRAALGVDGATWSRGRGWALSVALIQLPYYRDTNYALAENSRHVIAEVLAEL